MTDISQQLKTYAELIENLFDDAVPICGSNYSVLQNAMLYSLKTGGKRIRPIIMLEFYKLCGGKEEGITNFAVALEMIHTYSLIHDDLPCIDNDDFRRGNPSCHKAFGENIAVLAGDSLLTEAFAYASKSQINNKSAVVEAIGELAKYAGANGMIGGQVIDIAGEAKLLSSQTLNDMYRLKTAALLVSAARIGCILAESGDKAEFAQSYAENIGIAFQIVDDILDLCSDLKTLGKPVHSDEKNNKNTFAHMNGIENSRKAVEKLTAAAVEVLSNFSGDSSFLRNLAFYLVDRKY